MRGFFFLNCDNVTRHAYRQDLGTLFKENHTFPVQVLSSVNDEFCMVTGLLDVDLLDIRGSKKARGRFRRVEYIRLVQEIFRTPGTEVQKSNCNYVLTHTRRNICVMFLTTFSVR